MVALGATALMVMLSQIMRDLKDRTMPTSCAVHVRALSTPHVREPLPLTSPNCTPLATAKARTLLHSL